MWAVTINCKLILPGLIIVIPNVWLTPALVACMDNYFKTSITKKTYMYDIVSPICTTVCMGTLKPAKTRKLLAMIFYHQVEQLLAWLL